MVNIWQLLAVLVCLAAAYQLLTILWLFGAKWAVLGSPWASTSPDDTGRFAATQRVWAKTKLLADIAWLVISLALVIFYGLHAVLE
jgi:hypothetical protein